MPTPSFGKGNQLLGGTDALRSAMQTRGIDTSVLDQMSGFAGASPVPQGIGSNPPPTMQGAPVASPNAPQQMSQGQGVSSNPDISMIIKALTKYLGDNQKNLGVGSNMPSF